jgi:diaminohydroxyphosphoribosylaminopyrimidine deaminase / 5-amino-6-(5-phosphoribosylamino)uracil reductase
VASPAEIDAMRRAIALADRGAASARPNPAVGCVILAVDGSPVGEGWHQVAGGPHAEIVALRDAAEESRGATAVVTLEPCHLHGRTGPCTQALLAAGIARVVYAVDDPTANSGGGAELRALGIDVESGVLRAPAELSNLRWLTAVRRHRAFVTWKYAATLDGRVAATDGSSRWITGEPAREDVHRWRSESDAVIVGIGTVLADDPHLTTRCPDGSLADEQPLRVVVDSEGRISPRARVCDDAAETWIATASELGRDETGRVDLAALVCRLLDRGRQAALLEGGPTLAGGFVRAGLVDRVVGYVAPRLLGAGPAALGNAGISTLPAAMRLAVHDVTRIGSDVRIVAHPCRDEEN